MEKRSLIRRRIIQNKYLYMMFALPFVYYVMFAYMPMYGIVIAFKKFNAVQGILGSQWVGMKYFTKYLTDSYFWQIVKNTFILNFLDLIIGFPLPIIFALLLSELRSGKFRRIVQTSSYLPHFCSIMVVCGMLTNFLQRTGIINDFLVLFGAERVAYLGEAEYFRAIFVASGIWQNMGWSAIIYFAALSGVNVELYEVAEIDGANRWQKAMHVSLPSIAMTIAIMLILRCGHILSSNTQKILLLYNGKTMPVADVIGTYIYRRGLLDNNFSYSTAVGLFDSVIGFFMVVFVNAFSKRISGNGLW